MPFRISLKHYLIFETTCLAFASLLIRFFPDAREDIFFGAGMFLVYLIMHGSLVPFKGLEFVPADAEDDTLVTVYWWLSIFLAPALSKLCTDIFFGHLRFT